MKKIDIVILYLALSAMLFAQPGKSRGPGGQYTDRMEIKKGYISLLKSILV